MSKYVTVQGDMFDKISYEQYGSETYFDRIMKANPEHRDVYVFPSGIELEIPDIDEQTSTSDTIPPWKDVSG